MATKAQPQFPSLPSPAAPELAMQQLYAKHRRRVYSLCSLLSAEAGQAETLTRSVFIRVLQHAASESPEEFQNHCDLQVVKQSRALAGSTRHPAVAAAVRGSAPLPQAIRALPPTERLLFVMHTVGGLPLQRLCPWLELGTADGARHLGRARLHLARQLSRPSALSSPE